MANQRISDLVQLSASNAALNNLLPIVNTNSQASPTGQTSKITLGDLAQFVIGTQALLSSSLQVDINGCYNYPLSASNGGTGVQYLVSNSVIIGQGTGSVTFATGNVGDYLVVSTNGPQFQSPLSGGFVVTASGTTGNNTASYAITASYALNGGGSGGGSGVQPYITYLGDGINSQFSITHNLRTKNLFYSVINVTSSKAVIPEISFDTNNIATIYFSKIIPSQSYQISLTPANGYYDNISNLIRLTPITAVLGDGINTSYTITHNFNTRNLFFSVYNTSTLEVAYPDISFTSNNSITVNFNFVVPFNTYQITISPGNGILTSGSLNGSFVVTSSVANDNTTASFALNSNSSSYSTTNIHKVNVYTFTASTIYTPSSNLIYCTVEGVGGGGGGSGTSTCNNTQVSAGGGGGGGGYFKKTLIKSQLSTTCSIIIGTGGSGGTSGGGSGGTGGTTSFTYGTSSMYAYGGGGTNGGPAEPYVVIARSTAIGGSASGGDENRTGGCGGVPSGTVYASIVCGGSGGSAGKGNGGVNSYYTSGPQPGNNCPFYGGGGGGGANSQNNSGTSGGSGGSGVIIITEYTY